MLFFLKNKRFQVILNIMLIDAHGHIQFPAYDQDREEVVKRAKDNGVKMIAVGTQAATSEAAIKIAEKYPEDIWATVGFHPNHVVAQISADQNADLRGWHHDENEQKETVPEKFDIEKLRELAKHPKVVAIGECGLDYFRIKNHEASIKEKQKEVFLEQLKLAQELKKPLMIHCRPSKGTDDAYQDLLYMIHDSRFTLHKIVHFYVGSLAITKKLLDAGFYFTFGGVITFARDYDEVIKYIPLERILLETDAPYVAPEPYRGKRNEPAYIIETVKKMAELKAVTYDKILDITTETARKIFKI